MNPFGIFKTHETESAIAQQEGKEPKFYPHGADGKPLTEMQAAWYSWTTTGAFVDPRDPKFIVGYPIKGSNGLWYQFDAAGELVLWSGGDPERFIRENPLPDRSRPTPDQVSRLYEAAFPA